ncbi:methyl-accepting chemotaxis protein [Ectothiorhodospira haloalkaliphila]|uniref:methyl-accepting chemotaxis protein n=1 Tax=Ectothiorhodospira haloalkaliphila TaxID=421628 RepID=UPI0006873A4F|nr:methyl-accepting chemotaxis protein [Ectothiorhodospira haloalkaliphila]
MLKNISLKVRLIVVIAFLSALLMVIGGMGLTGMQAANDGLETVYDDRLIPSQQIAEIESLMQANIIQLNLAAMHDPRLEESRLHDHPIQLHTNQVRENIRRIDQVWSAYMETFLTPEEERLASQFADRRGRFVREGLLESVRLYEEGQYAEANIRMIEVTNPLFGEATELARALLQLQLNVGSQEFESAVSAYETTRNLAVIMIAAGVLISALMGFLLIRAIVTPLNRAVGYFEAISDGNLDNEIVITRNDEIGKVLGNLADMQGKLKADITETRRVAAENLRVRFALDNVSSSVMVAAPDMKIIYTNRALETMFQEAGEDIRTELPGFDAGALLGAKLDVFRDKLGEARQKMENTRTLVRTELDIGGCIFRLIASPIVDAQGQRVGTVMEWVDRTSEVHVETEVTSLVDGAVKGDFSRRVDTEELEGFFKRLGDGVNTLMATTSAGLSEVAAVLEAVSEGDLTKQVTGDYEGTFGELKDDTNKTVARLRDLIGQIKESVDAINTASREIAVGNTDLSQRTEEQASSLEQTASSMEELTSTVKQNADNARQASEMSNQASSVAQHGGQKVDDAVESIKAITASSEKISDIITVIDGIAFQTNILALNAAVEAARAGEQGRGFAVVAGEVRNLAQRSASAAKEIKDLIAENAETTEKGSRLVLDAGKAMEEMVGQVKRVSDLINEIAAASDEQTTGIEQVNSAVTQMDEVTQQNASLVEEAAAAAESLEEQAQGLARAVSVFRVDDLGSGGKLVGGNTPAPALPKP